MHHPGQYLPCPQPQDYWMDPVDGDYAQTVPVMHISDESYPKSVQPAASGSRNSFVRTMRDMEEQFYATFPAARAAHTQKWQMDVEPECSPNDEQSSMCDTRWYQSPAATSGSDTEYYPSSMHLSPAPPSTYNPGSMTSSTVMQNNATSPTSPSIASQPPQGGSHLARAPPSGFHLTSPVTSPINSSTDQQAYMGSTPTRVVPSQDFPRTISSNRYPTDASQSSRYSQSSPKRYSQPPPMSSLELDSSMFPLRITPNPNLPVQDIIIPTIVRSAPPPPPVTYTHYSPQSYSYLPAPGSSYQRVPSTYTISPHQNQYSGSSGPYGHAASRDEEGQVVPPSWPPLPGTATTATVPSPSPPLQDPIESGETTATNTSGKSGKKGDKKPPLACLFCRGRKIACGSPVPGGDENTCNQCQRRSLKCDYPSESRRGMRKKRSISDLGLDSDTQPAPSKSARTKR